MLINIAFRLLFLIKWALQIPLAAFCIWIIFCEPDLRSTIVNLIIPGIIVAVEALVLGIFWVLNGANEFSNRSKENSFPIFSETIVKCAFWGYLILCSAIVGSLGNLLYLGVLGLGISAYCLYRNAEFLQKITKKLSIFRV